MIEIFALSPGLVRGASQERALEARLYLAWLWRKQVEVRQLGCCCSLLMRPFEWLFPIARVDGRWIRLGCAVKPRQLRERLGLQVAEGYACVVVPAGQSIFNSAETAGTDGEPPAPAP